jgi:hypothetical protein
VFSNCTNEDDVVCVSWSSSIDIDRPTAYSAGGFQPGELRDAATWSIDGVGLVMFGGSRSVSDHICHAPTVEEDWGQLAANYGVTDTELYSSVADLPVVDYLDTMRNLDFVHEASVHPPGGSSMDCQAYSDELWTLRPGGTWVREEIHMPGQSNAVQNHFG